MKEAVLYDNYNQDEDLFFIDNIKSSEYNLRSFIITGYVKSWTGYHEIYPVKMDGLLNAIYKCTDKMDYIVIEFINGHLELKCTHHDGTNNFQIYMLSEEGENYYNQDIDSFDKKYSENMILEKIY